MAALACVLCFCELTKASDRNLVENKGEFSVKRELEDLHFVVHPTSQHICRACFRSLQQRRNHQNKVEDLIPRKSRTKGTRDKNEVNCQTLFIVQSKQRFVCAVF